MARYFIYLSYDGSNYHGWQIQPNAATVQETLEKAIALLMRYPVAVTGAGRTDTGVNATTMVAHADFPEEIDCDQTVYRLNKILPPDIAIHTIKAVTESAHARFDALSRRYRYHISTAKNPFNRRYSYRVTGNLDFEKMNRAAATLPEYTDFTSFSKLHTDTKTNNCKVTSAKWIQVSANEWYFEIEADRFLRNMVRAIVGTLLMVGRDKITVEEFREIITKKQRSEAGDSALAQALFLEEVKYPENIFL
ncbi:MAG: tRNA pseudouridine(38-40) synthase TruA [Bacteroidaceae bacterium]|nr:tRNA pseudouridine(38-40) synthase TruA [Bacteroidaceae bacterium]